MGVNTDLLFRVLIVPIGHPWTNPNGMARIARLYDYKGSIGVKFRRYNNPSDGNTYLFISNFYRRSRGEYFLRTEKYNAS